MYLYAKNFDFCQVDRRASVVERLNELKVSAKRRRTGRLGGGSRADMELRRAVALLGARLSETTARRSRIRADEVPADGSSNHSGGNLSMVTAGDGGGKKSRVPLADRQRRRLAPTRHRRRQIGILHRRRPQVDDSKGLRRGETEKP